MKIKLLFLTGAVAVGFILLVCDCAEVEHWGAALTVFGFPSLARVERQTGEMHAEQRRISE